MKIRRGERVLCPGGHIVGHVTVDVADDDPVPAEALSITGPQIRDTRQGYACGRCGEPVALLDDGDRWSVRSGRGWVS